MVSKTSRPRAATPAQRFTLTPLGHTLTSATTSVAGAPAAGALSILDEARRIVYGDREQTHGEPARNLQAIATMWTPIFGAPVTPQQVCLAMIALKVARAVNSPAHRDHWTDVAGYVALAERCGFVQAPEVKS